MNYEFFDNQTVASARQLVDQLRSGERPLPTRGAPLCSFKQIERQIAGFFTDETLALDSVSSGVPTEVGVHLAIERGDTAPSYAAGDGSTNGRGPGRESQRPSSANDAPLQTSQSDAANPDTSEGDADTEPGEGKQ